MTLPEVPRRALNGAPRPAKLRPEAGPTDQALALLDAWRTTADPDDVPRIDQVTEIIAALRAEVLGLRTALTSRATIDQAKGIVMAQEACDEDTAFQVLVQKSKDSNVPLREVARALVYLAAGEG